MEGADERKYVRYYYESIKTSISYFSLGAQCLLAKSARRRRASQPMTRPLPLFQTLAHTLINNNRKMSIASFFDFCTHIFHFSFVLYVAYSFVLISFPYFRSLCRVCHHTVSPFHMHSRAHHILSISYLDECALCLLKHFSVVASTLHTQTGARCTHSRHATK